MLHTVCHISTYNYLHYSVLIDVTNESAFKTILYHVNEVDLSAHDIQDVWVHRPVSGLNGRKRTFFKISKTGPDCF